MQTSCNVVGLVVLPTHLEMHAIHGSHTLAGSCLGGRNRHIVDDGALPAFTSKRRPLVDLMKLFGSSVSRLVLHTDSVNEIACAFGSTFNAASY